MFGCYGALVGGNAFDALIDMTGGVGEAISLVEVRNKRKDDPKVVTQLYERMEFGYQQGALMCSSLKVGMDVKVIVTRRREIWIFNYYFQMKNIKRQLHVVN